MNQFFIFKDNKITKSEDKDFKKNDWIHLPTPSQQEIKMLIDQFGIPKDFFKYSLDIHENARIEKENDKILIVLKTACAAKKDGSEITYETLPFGIILTEKKIITISPKRNNFIESVFIEKISHISVSNHFQLILHIILAVAELYLNYLNEINYLIENNETLLQSSMKNERLFELLKLQKTLVYFTTSLKTNYIVIEKFKKDLISEKEYMELKSLIDDTIIEYRQAIEMTTIASKVLFNTMNTFASIISNNLNSIMKFLTLIAIILTLPVVISSVYGMNIALPFQAHPYAFWLIALASLILSAVAVVFFIKKKWF